MTHKHALRLAAAAATLGLSGCASMLLPPNITPVAPPSKSVAQADSRLQLASAERARAEAEYAASEQVCYAKFFVNNCLDKAKEKRRSTLATVSAIEVEAEYFKRKSAVEERDREVARAVKEYEASEAVRAATPEPPVRPMNEAVPKAPKASVSARRASQEAKRAQREADEIAAAPRRAESARKFEQRRVEAEQRQKRVAEKLAEKKAKAEAKAGTAVPPGQ